MKYEMIFGDERLFDGAPEMATHATKGCGFYGIHDGMVEYVSDGIFNGMKISSVSGYLIAERRIIKEPKRWTWEDKKAGRSPEVDSIFSYRDETLTCHFIDGDGEVWAHDIDNKIVTPLLRDCQPIETPAEKAQREEDEFVSEHDESSLGVVCMDSSHRKCYELGKRAAYRKLKGGE